MIRLLRDFDEQYFRKSHDMDLMEEDDRLEELNSLTLRWWQEMDRGLGE